MKGIKKLLTVLVVLTMCLELIPGIALANEPTYTWYAVARNNITFLNTQDGKTMTEFNYNNVNSGNNGANWGYYGGYTKEKFLAMYLKFDLTELKGKDITDAVVYAGFSGTGSSFKMYGIPNNDWNDTTAPVIDRSEGNLVASASKMSPSVKDDFGERNAEFACGNLIKKALANGDSYICFEIECTNSGAYSTIWGKSTSSPSYPKLAYQTSSNKAPVVTVTTDKAAYNLGETATVTANATDPDGDSFTYSFKVDGAEITENVNGNSFTISNLDYGTHSVEAICTDEYGASGVGTCEISIKKVSEKTKTTVPRNKTVFLNTQDGKTAAEFNYNNVNSGNNGINWGYYGGATRAKFLAMYLKFDISDFADANVSDAKVYAGFGGNGTSFRMYGIPNKDWDDTTAPVIDRSEGNLIASVTKMSSSVKDDFGERNAEFACGDLVKKAIARGDKFICFELECANGDAYSSIWGKASTSPSYPKLYLETSSNKVPVVTATTDKDKYTDTDDIVVTASATDPDGDDFTFSFKVDGVLDTEHALGNVLTLPPLSSGEHEIDVICTDEYGDYSIYNIVLNITGAPVKKWNSVSSSEVINSYDNMTIADYNNANQFSQPYNYVLSGSPDKPMQFYVKFDISSYKNKDISEASLIWWIQSSNHRGANLRVYGLAPEKWDTITAPEVDRSEANTLVATKVPNTILENYTEDDPKYSYAAGMNYIFGDTQAEIPDYGITDYIKEQLALGKTEVCFVIQRLTTSYSTASKSSLPRLAIRTTTNKVPSVTLKPNKNAYNAGDTVVLTAEGTDSDIDSTLTYKFFIDGIEADSSLVNDNVLTLGEYYGNEHIILVKCYDNWNDYGVAIFKLSTAPLYIVNAELTGEISAGVSQGANFDITNNDANALKVYAAVAIYKPDGKLYSVKVCEKETASGANSKFDLNIELPSEGDFEGYSAKAFVWRFNNLAPLIVAVK